MNGLVLALLLLFFVGAGLLMRPTLVRERFTDMGPVSPALANLITTPPQAVQIDKLGRDKEIMEQKPSCPKCPDMSQYVRLDEVPCWNCSLP